MKVHYPWLWFDADGTLFDYDRAEGLALRLALESQDLPDAPNHLSSYREINAGLWRAVERGEITPHALRVRRFELFLQAAGLHGSPERLSEAYVQNLAEQAALNDGAHELLSALHPACRIAIVTNGLRDVQRSRLERSSIREFIACLIISEEVGASKPAPAFFEAAFERTGAEKGEVLVIGDSLSSDMRGAADSGLASCWYNPGGAIRPAELPITYEIASLPQLLDLVE